MGILIDSSILIDFERKGIALSSIIDIHGRGEEEIFISVISASELLHGVHRSSSPPVKAKRLSFVEGILANIPVLMIDLKVARSHAQLWADLAARGEMIGLHDSWIAATCIAHGLSLATGNVREFRRVPSLQIEQWG